MNIFKVGDTVKIVKKPMPEENCDYWNSVFMDITVGQINTIKELFENSALLSNGYSYPFYVLEKVSECFKVSEPGDFCHLCNFLKECNPTGDPETEMKDETIETVKQPICPINLYFEGDENKCDTFKCDWDTKTRSCSETCSRIEPELVVADEIPEGNPEIKDYLLDKDKIASIGHVGVGPGTTHTDKELFESKDAMLPGKGITFHKFEKPDSRILKTFDNSQQKVDYTIEISTHELTALCPLTSFPDFYDLKISYRPALKCIESKSAKFYFHSFRDYGGFIETLANMIADHWVEACVPKWLKVELTMAPRGGIPITVIVERNQPLMIV